MMLAYLYNCFESQFMIYPPIALHSSIDNFVLPTAVVPTMKIISGFSNILYFFIIYL